MSDLTEKWKKSELEDGDYYIKIDDGEIYPDYYDGGSGFIKTYDYVIEKILAPVPTYQEYLESEAHCAVYSEENKWLRELMKECHRFVKGVKFSEERFMPKCQQDLLIKINAVIGESEE